MHRWTLGNCARGTKKTDTQVVPAKARVSKNEWSCCSLEENTFRNLCRRKPHFKSSEDFHFCVRGSGSIDNRLFHKTTTNSGLSTSCGYLSQFYPKAPPGPCAATQCAKDNTAHVGTYAHAGLGTRWVRLWSLIHVSEMLKAEKEAPALSTHFSDCPQTYTANSSITQLRVKWSAMPYLPKQCQLVSFQTMGLQFTFKSKQCVLPSTLLLLSFKPKTLHIFWLKNSLKRI